MILTLASFDSNSKASLMSLVAIVSLAPNLTAKSTMVDLKVSALWECDVWIVEFKASWYLVNVLFRLFGIGCYCCPWCLALNWYLLIIKVVRVVVPSVHIQPGRVYLECNFVRIQRVWGFGEWEERVDIQLVEIGKVWCEIKLVGFPVISLGKKFLM